MRLPSSAFPSLRACAATDPLALSLRYAESTPSPSTTTLATSSKRPRTSTLPSLPVPARRTPTPIRPQHLSNPPWTRTAIRLAQSSRTSRRARTTWPTLKSRGSWPSSSGDCSSLGRSVCRLHPLRPKFSLAVPPRSHLFSLSLVLCTRSQLFAILPLLPFSCLFGRLLRLLSLIYVTFPSSSFSALSHKRPLLEGSRQGTKVHVRAFVLGVLGRLSLTRARRQLKLREEGREMDGTHELLPDLLPPSFPRTLSSTQGLPQSSRRCFQILECFPSAFSPASSVALLFVLARSRNLVSRTSPTLPRPSPSPFYPSTELLSPLSVALDNPILWTPSPSKNFNRRP